MVFGNNGTNTYKKANTVHDLLSVLSGMNDLKFIYSTHNIHTIFKFKLSVWFQNKIVISVSWHK